MIQFTYNQTSHLCITVSIRVNNWRVRLDIFDTTQNLRTREDFKIITTLDVLENSFASDEDIREDYPETNLELIEESTSRDEILLLYQQQLTTEQTVDRCHGGRGTLTSDQFVCDTVQEGQVGKFPPNSEDYVLKLGCDY
jgi:hypothetical protein